MISNVLGLALVALVVLQAILPEVIDYARQRKAWRKEGAQAAAAPVFDWMGSLKVVALCGIAAALLLSFRVIRVSGTSMDGTLYDGQFVCSVLTNDESRANLRRGEIVSLQPEGCDYLVIKRIVGVPGDTVGIWNGNLYINGTCVQESYLNEPMVATEPGHFWQIPQGYYFVLGDNRNVSLDSRSYGPVSEEAILAVGKVGIGIRGVDRLQPPKVLAEIACRPGV